MNFLTKTFSSLTGSSIPYTFKEKVVSSKDDAFPGNTVIWNVYNGLNPKHDNDPVTIFEYNLRDVELTPEYASLARNCFRKSKTLKLPGVLSAIDYYEDDSYLYIVTERVTPLYQNLQQNQALSYDCKEYGIYQIGSTLEHINNNKYLHGNVNVFNSVYVTAAGDWKLFGFELLTNLTSDPDQPIYRLSKYEPAFHLSAPEDGIDSVRENPYSLDSYKFGVFIYSIFHFQKLVSSQTPITNTQLKLGLKNINSELDAQVRKLNSGKAHFRPTIQRFMKDFSRSFDSNHLITFSNELEILKFQDEAQKLFFFKNGLDSLIENSNSDKAISSFPPGYLEYKVLPELLSQYNNIFKKKPTINTTPEEHQQRQETISILLTYILKFGASMSESTFTKYIKPIIFQSFSMQDRSVRLILLNNLSQYEPFLTESDVQSKIFYPMLTGFSDTNFMIREATLTSISVIIDKCSVKHINQELLKVLAKSQMDPKPSIRINTLILIIKLSNKIYSNSKNNVLITALSKSLKDDFTPCKLMALSGFETLINEFSLTEICGKILGHLAVSLMDPKSYKTRQEARRVFDLYLKSVEEHGESLPKNEPDDDAEEEAFLAKYGPQKPVQDNSETSSNSNWGIGAFGIFAGISSSDQLVQTPNPQNVSTPDLTRVPTAEAFTNSKPPTEDDDFELNENWGDELETDMEPQPIIKTRAPRKPLPKAPISAGHSHKSSSLKLGGKSNSKKTIGSSLKLDVKIDDDDQWDGEW